MTARHLQASTEGFLSPSEENLAQLFRDLKPMKRSNTHPSLGNVLSRATDSKFTCVELKTASMIDNEFAKVTAYLCSESHI